MDNAFWRYCVQTRASAYAVNQKFGGPDSMASGPCWCFQRMGQAHVALPDGRDVYIAGEHEDHYDPDFYIYNDVVIVDGEDIRIFGYPESDFPATDFHTATLVGRNIFLIGNLGYPENRMKEQTQVYRLELESWKILPVSTSGVTPGWIHEHSATLGLDGNKIAITGGKRCGQRITENFDDYELDLNTFFWTKSVERNWSAWILEREDGEPNKLWEIRSESWNRKLGLSTSDQLREILSELPDEVISELSPEATNRQIEQLPFLYQSPFDGSVATEDEENHGRYRLVLGATTVRFDEDMYGVTVTVEGELPDTLTNQLLHDLQQRLTNIENSKYVVAAIDD